MYYRTDTSSQPGSSANPQLFRPPPRLFFLRARGGGDGGVLRGFGAGDDAEAGVALVEDLGKGVGIVSLFVWLLFVCMYVCMNRKGDDKGKSEERERKRTA